MAESNHVFHDPSGRRKRVVKVALLSILAAISLSVWYAHRLFHRIDAVPAAKDAAGTAAELEHERNKRISQALLKTAKSDLDREIRETESLAKRLKIRASETRVWAIYEADNQAGYYSLKANPDAVSDLVISGFNLSADGSSLEEPKLNSTAEDRVRDAIALARERGTKIFGRLTNDSIDGYLAAPVDKLAESPENRKQIIRSLVVGIQAKDLAGLIIDFREIPQNQYFKLLPFFEELRQAWNSANLTQSLGIAFPAAESDLPMWKFGEIFDVALMRASGGRTIEDSPGAAASGAWFNNSLQFALRNIPPAKLVVMADNSSLDWTEGGKRAERRTYLAALLKAKEVRERQKTDAQIINFDPSTFNSTFAYVDDSGAPHTVWMSDAVNSYNQYCLAYEAGLRQSGIWSLGTEDPGVWSFLGREPSDPAIKGGLETMVFPYHIQSEGRGDLLIPQADVRHGARLVSLGGKNNLAVNSSYTEYPSAYVVQHLGYKPKKIAITFDDGPVEPYTNQILDILKRENVKASFFVIGQHVQENPEILRRIHREGHDIGNHTFTHPELSLVSTQRQILELNATQRLVQSILGRSLILFRPPYVTEGSPVSQEEARVIKTAADLQYLTVGISADVQDWELYKKELNGEEVRRTGEDLADELLAELDRMQGNVILFHDGPKLREATVDAVGLLIPELKKRGYDLVSLSRLLGREDLLPEVDEKELLLTGLSRAYIETGYIIRSGLEIIFILVAVFGVVRLLSFIIMSMVSKRRETPYNPALESFKPPVSIIIAAYNESKVIRRTIQSLLASEYSDFEIIVVDDGSTDNTSEIVRTYYGAEPKVRLITKANGGKSSALNVGLEVARYEIIIGLDADTQYSPNAIGAMARHFADERVGAVAGNVKVGNRDSWLLQCQSIEYITNQNFGRRAFSVVDAITVVPGAAGAWRKKAIQDVGGYLSDTLGEDMELTWRVRMAGYSICFEPLAHAYTEAPDTLGGVFKQRFRWMYGQFQILWKHRGAFFNSDYGWFGWFGAPLVLMDDVFLILSPIADLQALIAIFSFGIFLSQSSSMSMEALANAGPWVLFAKTMILYVIFFLAEVLCTIFAFKLDKEPLRPIWLLFVKQFFYRQLVYIVTYKAIWRALTGWRQRWGVLQRTGTVGASAQ